MNAEPKLVRRTTTNGHAGTDAAAHLAHDLIDRAAKHLETSEERLRQSARNAEKTLKTSLKAAQSRGRQAGDSTRSVLQQHPFAAVGVALGLGVIIALLAGSSRRNERPETDVSE